ncbi:MAG: hypothetical protein HPY90_07760 [Syntrophothermus sp.]|uniref:hypothetical protein n=1 Tax=Syntrophothermus sp. TaxID=2736299 RepID=UPI00257CA83C|nr:hypothetical protein [Syntrophothermus sp.]NSW83156.1 hypothetical protein [Syntrophothermus sp.]
MSCNFEKLVCELEEGLSAIPILDVHTHLDAEHLSARGLHDILLYHMVKTDLLAAGCPDGERLSEDPDEAEVYQRLRNAIPYLRYIRNTSGFWGVKTILRELYGWSEQLTEDNWQKVHAIIRERSEDQAWARYILQRAGVRRASTEYWRRRDGRSDDVLQYSLEWAFFARNQRGQNDIALYELERTWSQEEVSGPLPVALDLNSRRPVERPIRTVSDVHAAMEHYAGLIPYDQLLSTAQHISTDIDYRTVSEEEMPFALRQRENATIVERDIYCSYILELFLSELERRGDHIVFQFSLGAEPSTHETISKLKTETVSQLAEMIERHPKLRFQVFLSSSPFNQAICTLVRELPNLSVAGYWWHSFFPPFIRQTIAERLDMVPANKQVGFFSDGYCVDWVFAKAIIVRKQLALVLADKVVMGQYTKDEALAIARQILFETPQTLVGMQPN